MEGPNIRLPASQATASALVVNELLMNAIEHGLQGPGQTARFASRSRIWATQVRIMVVDNGLGLPADFDPPPAGYSSRSLGLQIVHTLVTDDLKGELLIEPSCEGERVQGLDDGVCSGTRAVITFPKPSINVESPVAKA